MLRVEIDIFSGRPNPVWIITDTGATRDFLGSVADTKGATAKPETGFTGLGFREVQVTILADDEVTPRKIPKQFALASTGAKNFKASAALARRLLETMPLRSDVQLLEHSVTPLTPDLRDLVLEQFDLFVRKPPRRRAARKIPPNPNPLRTTVEDHRCSHTRRCLYEVSQYNPYFWNNAATRPHNNCYNYARNWRTDTFAQPGRAHGVSAKPYNCANVTTAAMADGIVKRCNCLPQSEEPRRLMALVIWPGADYHWYREQRGGFWGHKPGKLPARNYDNSVLKITNPETCNRGNYTVFCEYFYAGASVVIN